MPEPVKVHRETFIKSVRACEKFLQERFKGLISSLPDKELEGYDTNHRFVRGWKIKDGSLGFIFKVLIPQQFPYSIPRIAIEDIQDETKDLSNHLPHLEGRGLLCLPKLKVHPENPTGPLNQLLQLMLEYVSIFTSHPERAKEDFQKEFISYWNRKVSKKAGPILSLIKQNSETHGIVVGRTADGVLIVADSKDALNTWYINRYHSKPTPVLTKGLFIKLSEAPVPTFPDTIKDLRVLIEKTAPTAREAFERNILNSDPYVIILASENNSGAGLVGISIEINTERTKLLKGFRGTAYMPLELRVTRLENNSGFKRRVVVRIDHEWVHGRGKDMTQEQLKNKQITILGCGALGSHVAIRLAQAGIGKINLVDPELLETANVGRHVLGMKSVTVPKTHHLTKELRERFPHISTISFPVKFESFIQENLDSFEKSDLIISTMGEWSAEGALNEWHFQRRENPAIVYGWMEPRAAVAHAVLIKPRGACLRCILTEDGDMREPDSEKWPNGDGLDSEPACGSQFQPFGPVDLAFAEALVSDLAISFLVGDQKESTHTVHTVSEARMKILQGEWSDTHKKFRPKDFKGSFQYERPLFKDPECIFCSKII